MNLASERKTTADARVECRTLSNAARRSLPDVLNAELRLSPTRLRMPVLFALPTRDMPVHDVPALRAVRHRSVRSAVVHVVARRLERTCHQRRPPRKPPLGGPGLNSGAMFFGSAR